MTSFIILLSLLIDRILAEPGKFHPLTGFGNIASWLENKLLSSINIATGNAARLKACLSGFLACLLLVSIPTILLMFISYTTVKNNIAILIVDVIVLYLVIGARSLEQHALQVKTSLLDKNIQTARKNVSYMVSRETGHLDEEGLCKATIESVLENGSDAIFAPVFWFLIAGAPGALFYRLVNTLDAMWGYRNGRYRYFGWFAARLDDVLNWIPARITALTYSISGNFIQGLHCWQTQSKKCESPNAGPVMASGAGALNLQLGGSAIYHNENKMKPVLGQGLSPGEADIDRAIILIKKAVVLCLLSMLCIDLFRWLY